MKRAKLVLFLLVLGFVMLGVYQNVDVLRHTETLRLNLGIQAYETQPIALFLYFIGFFLLGILLSYVHGLSSRFKARSEIKNHVETIAKLEEEIKVLQSLSGQQQSAPAQNTHNT
jgi:hypothetical protein